MVKPEFPKSGDSAGVRICNQGECRMSLLRVLLCIFLPPLAVIDRPVMVFLIVLLLTILGWIPGIIGAIYFNTQPSVTGNDG